MEKILDVKNLEVSFHTYAGEVKAVRDVSFHLEAGETLAVVGESGCGKTVTSKSIMRLLPEPPAEIKSNSSIKFDGIEVTELAERKLRELRGGDIAMIFQDPMTSLNPTMKIGDQIMESLKIHRKLSNKQAKEEAIRMLKIVNVPSPEKRVEEYPHQFSGGMRQRAMIAIALSCNPKILIADEPTTALDVTIQSQIMKLMKNLQKDFGTAIILVTHDLGVVADIADRIQVMYAGQIVERGTKEEIFYSPKHPYTWALLKSVPTLKTKNKAKLYSLNGTPPDLLAPPVGCAFAVRCEYSMDVCKEVQPIETILTETQSVTCWLQHEMAPSVRNPITKEES